MSGFAIAEIKAGTVSVIKECPKMLAFVKRLKDTESLKECKAQAAAILAYLAQRKHTSVQEHNAAVKIKARVEHRLGQVLAETVKPRAGAGRPSKIGDTVSPISNGQLPKQITKKQSSRAQQVAAIPWEEIEARIDAKTEKKQKASQGRIVNRLLEEEKQKALAMMEPINDPSPIIQEDCLEMVGTFTERPRLIFADPPYNIGIDYGEGIKADTLPEDQYLDWCQTWMNLCAEQLADDGSMWVLINDEWADHFGIMLRCTGLHRRAWVKWYETFGVNCAKNFNRCSRHLFYCVKNPKKFVFNTSAVKRPSDRQQKYADERAEEEGKIWDDVWMIPRLVGTAKERIPEFPTQLPLALLRPIVACCSDPGDLVLDPFCGSATTGVAAAELGRKFLGIEKSKKFAVLARKRLKPIATS